MQHIDKNLFSETPSWANYIAMDPSGEWYFYERMPVKSYLTGIWDLDRPFNIRVFSPDSYAKIENATNDIYYLADYNDIISEPDPVAEYLDAAIWLKPTSEVIGVI